MKVLLTGATSFTGLWFAKALKEGGADVVAPIRGRLAEYEGIRGERARRVAGLVDVVENAAFGDEAFLASVKDQKFDALCHHAAQVSNYRSPDFDVAGALADNTRNLRLVLEEMKRNGLKAVIATGSVFEQDEGLGDPPHNAFSPYGLSKGITWQAIRYWGAAFAVPTGKFVIANPFGPFEEPRFLKYLVDRWRAGETPEVRTPLYLRDNIHVDLLATAYARFVSQLVTEGRDAQIGVSGYRETQGSFAERVAREMRPRLGLECRLVLAPQTDFSEPMVRLNGDRLDMTDISWDEAKAWDGLATYYRGGLQG